MYRHMEVGLVLLNRLQSMKTKFNWLDGVRRKVACSDVDIWGNAAFQTCTTEGAGGVASIKFLDYV